MTTDALKKLKEFILQYNQYFVDAFHNVSMNPKGFIMCGDVPVFPDDGLGNYFYLRVPNAVQFDYSKEYIVAEGINPIGIKIPLVLVACVVNAKPERLLENLITTLQQYLPEDIKFLSATDQKEIVIGQELAKCAKADIEAARQKVDPSYSIVSISFTFTVPYQVKELNCIQSPC